MTTDIFKKDAINLDITDWTQNLSQSGGGDFYSKSDSAQKLNFSDQTNQIEALRLKVQRKDQQQQREVNYRAFRDPFLSTSSASYSSAFNSDETFASNNPSSC